MKVSVIMASYLGDYPGAGKNRDKKIIRAVNSFLNQTYINKELIIVADGCNKTKKIYDAYWKDNENIKFVFIPKQALFSGKVRDSGIKISSGEIITYLDNDDIIGKKHIETIVNQFDDDLDWVYYNDFLALNKEFNKFQKRWVQPRWASIGTSSISHRKSIDVIWPDGYGHDYLKIIKMISLGTKFKKLEVDPQYIVCHYKGADF